VATFYDMFSTEPKGANDVYVCTNISCSLLGADAILEAMQNAAGTDPRFHVRAFECLGACDIAPMASVNGEYIGPLTEDDCRTIVDDVLVGRPVLEAKQLRNKRAMQESARSADGYARPEAESPSQDAGQDAPRSNL
jgi:(2Fe-2S) ferredoxin